MDKKAIILFFPAPSEGVYDPDPHFPWTMLHLERMVRHLDIEVIFIDEYLEKNYKEIVYRTKDRLLFAGVSAIIGHQVISGKRFSEFVKTTCGSPVIWGGWFPSVFPEFALRDVFADYICVGPGEIPFRDFTERMLAGKGVEDIPGIGYIKEEKVFIIPSNVCVDAESFPQINKGLIDINKILDSNMRTRPESKVLPYVATFGCPFMCGFCNVPIVYKGKWSAKKISEIFGDIKYFIKYGDISQVEFWDSNFFINRDFVLRFCEEKIKEGLSFKWGAQAQLHSFIRNFSESDLKLIYEAGCRRIIIGAESGDQETLDFVNKKIKVSENLKMIKLCKKYNIRPRFHLMVCFPLNPNRDFYKTLNLAGRMLLADKRTEVNVRFYRPFPQTSIYQFCIEKGYVPPSSTSDLLSSFYNEFYPPWYKKDYLKILIYYLNFYFLFTDRYYYRRVSPERKKKCFVLNILMYPIVYIRIKLNIMRFPFEAGFFKRMMTMPKYRTAMYSYSINKHDSVII